MKRRISTWQIFSLLIGARLFSLMTYAPLLPEISRSAMAGVIVAVAAETLMALPLLAALKRGCAVRLCGGVFGFFYFVYFLAFAVISLTNAARLADRLLEYRFGWAVGLTVIAAAAVYGASLGIEALARSAAVTAAVTAAALFITFAASAAEVSPYDIHLSGGFIDGFLGEFSRSGETAAICVLGRFCEDAKKGFLSYMAARLIAVLTAVFFVGAAMGGFFLYSDYPILSLGSAFGIHAVERLDFLYLAVWALSAVQAVAVAVFACGETLLRGSIRRPAVIFGGIAAAVAALCLIYPPAEETVLMVVGFPSAALLLTALPLAVLLHKGKKGRNGDEKKNA